MYKRNRKWKVWDCENLGVMTEQNYISAAEPFWIAKMTSTKTLVSQSKGISAFHAYDGGIIFVDVI